MELFKRYLNYKNIVVYDIEIKNNPEFLPTKWKDFSKFGISVACSFDYLTMTYHVYMEDNLQNLIDRLNDPECLIVGFNIVNFDNKLLRYPLPTLSSLLKDEKDLNIYDMFLESKKACGFNGIPSKGFNLESHLKWMLLPCKNGEGRKAPSLYQTGKIGELVDYCLNDVFTEKSLFEEMYETQKCSCDYKQNYPIDISKIEKISGKYEITINREIKK